MPVTSNSSHPAAQILLVDDNTQGLCARKSVLEELGYRITIASSAHEALEQFARQKFDLLITDYKMPRMNGLELIAHIRKQQPSIPVILLSGFVDTLGLSEETTGADIVLQKSHNEVVHLVRSVSRLLNRKTARKQSAPERGTPSARRQSA